MICEVVKGNTLNSTVNEKHITKQPMISTSLNISMIGGKQFKAKEDQAALNH